MCTIQFVWRDSGYIHAGTIRTWIRTPDMMRDVLDMVNFVVNSHSMSDALDTYDTIIVPFSGVGRAALPTHREQQHT